MKYRIELASSNTASASSASGDFFGLYRFIKVKGTSTAISSSRDDYIEFPGAIFQCTGSSDRDRHGQQCVSIDFSAIGGPKDAKGFWDESEGGIRFFRDNKVWSKQ